MAQWMNDSISNSIQLQNNDSLKATCELRTSARWNHIHYLKNKKSISECMFSSVCLHEMIYQIQTVIHWMNINDQVCWHSLDSQIYFAQASSSISVNLFQCVFVLTFIIYRALKIYIIDSGEMPMYKST